MSSKINHTPGPWTTSKGSISVWANTTMPNGHKTTVPIVEATLALSDEEHEANAALIAAAPELLEALQTAIKHFSGHSGAIGDAVTAIEIEQRQFALEKARAAIAKATTH